MAVQNVVAPTDCPESVRNCCVIEVFYCVFVLSRCVFGISYGWRGFCHRTESELFIFFLSFRYPIHTADGDIQRQAALAIHHAFEISAVSRGFYCVMDWVRCLPYYLELKRFCCRYPIHTADGGIHRQAAWTLHHAERRRRLGHWWLIGSNTHP